MFPIVKLFRSALGGRAEGVVTVPVTIAVVQNDIDRGFMGNCERCPIHWAAGRAVPGAWAQVYPKKIRLIDRSGRRVTIGLPSSAVDFIAFFDRSAMNRYKSRPFSFTLDVPADFLAALDRDTATAQAG